MIFKDKIIPVIVMKEKKHDAQEYSLLKPSGEPQSVTELLNKYGTYEVQDTADTDNTFPAIAQGLPRVEKNRSIDKKGLKKHNVHPAE